MTCSFSLRFLAVGAVLAVTALGCGNLRVDAASPRPNVDVPTAMAPVRVDLDAKIADAFVIPATDSVNQVPVSSWRSTLTAGFANAFPGGSSGHVLFLRMAELTFAPAAIGNGGTAAVRAHIRFRASLADASGGEIGRISGDVDAHDAATSPTPAAMTANASQAVEAMYEQIGAKLTDTSAPK